MNVTCTNCGKRYLVSDEKVAGRASAKIRCRQCGAVVSVAEASRASAEAASSAETSATAGTETRLPTVASTSAQARAPDASPGRVRVTGTVRPAVAPPAESARDVTAIAAFDPGAVWFAMIAGAQVGPIDILDVAGRAARGEITARTYVWKNGMGDWRRASDVPEVLDAISQAKSPPPPPTPPAPAPRPLQRLEGDGGVPKTTTPMHPSTQQALLLAHQKTNPSFRRVPVPAQGRPSGAMRVVPQAAPGGAPAATNGGARAGAFDQAPEDTGFEVVEEEAETIVRPSTPRGPGTPVRQATAPLPQPAPEADAEPQVDDAGGFDVGVEADEGAAAPVEGDSSHSESDPFSSIAQSSKAELAPPGEATRFFINQAGVNKRNPPWKIALFILGLVGGPVGLLYLLSTLKLVELPTVPRTTEDGQVVQESFFSPSGISGIKDLLTGDAKRRREEAEAKAKAAAEAKAKADAEARERQERLALQQQQQQPQPLPDRDLPGAGTAETVNLASVNVKPEDLRGLYEEAPAGGPRPVVPKPRDSAATEAVAVNSGKGLSPEAIAKVVGDKQKAFNACIDRALRRNPRLSVGSVTVVLNVATSGVVTSASVKPQTHASSDWAQCMVSAGRRIVFPTSGEETIVEVPFKIGVALAP